MATALGPKQAMATLPAISSFLLLSRALTIHPPNHQLSLFHTSNQNIKTSQKQVSFKVQAAKLPSGVEFPKVEPNFKAPFVGFTRTAEIWNSRACVIGLIGTFNVGALV